MNGSWPKQSFPPSTLQGSKRILCLADRFFPRHKLQTAAANTGADLLGRTRNNSTLHPDQHLPDGSYLRRIHPSTSDRRRDPNAIIKTAFNELKIHLRAAQIVLRSKTPELIKQEFYGPPMAHFPENGGPRDGSCRSFGSAAGYGTGLRLGLVLPPALSPRRKYTPRRNQAGCPAAGDPTSAITPFVSSP